MAFCKPKACSATGIFYIDLLLSHVYAGYINDRGGQYLRNDFAARATRCMHTRAACWGWTPSIPRPAAPDCKLIDGRAHEFGGRLMTRPDPGGDHANS